MFNYLLYFFRPKYLVMKGIQIDDRSIMFVGAHPNYIRDRYGNKLLTFSNKMVLNTGEKTYTPRSTHIDL